MASALGSEVLRSLPALDNPASICTLLWTLLRYVCIQLQSRSNSRTANASTLLDTANLLVALNCLFCAGGCVGSLGQSGVADKLGRKKALAIAAVIALVGDALVAGSVAMSMMITARFVQGCGLGALLALVPIYLSEVAPPRSRGLLAGLTTFSFGEALLCAKPSPPKIVSRDVLTMNA